MIPSPTEAAIRALILPLAGCDCIWADQDAPRPPKPYIALRTLSTVGPENEHYLPVQADGGQPVKSHRDVTIELQAFGPGWYTLLGDLRQKLKWETTADRAYLAGIAIFDRGTVQDIGALLGDGGGVRGGTGGFWEPRGCLEIGVRALQATIDPVGLIETVNITGTLSGSSEPVFDASVSIVAPP